MEHRQQQHSNIIMILMAHGKKLSRQAHLRLNPTHSLFQLMDTMIRMQVRHYLKPVFLLKMKQVLILPHVIALLMTKIVPVINFKLTHTIVSNPTIFPIKSNLFPPLFRKRRECKHPRSRHRSLLQHRRSGFQGIPVRPDS